jgi:hypothetical protein
MLVLAAVVGYFELVGVKPILPSCSPRWIYAIYPHRIRHDRGLTCQVSVTALLGISISCTKSTSIHIPTPLGHRTGIYPTRKIYVAHARGSRSQAKENFSPLFSQPDNPIVVRNDSRCSCRQPLETLGLCVAGELSPLLRPARLSCLFGAGFTLFRGELPSAGLAALSPEFGEILC